MNVVIIDDEQHCIDRIQRLILNNCRELNVVATCTDVRDGINAIISFKPDLVFLDIQIGDQSGFDLLNAFQEINFDIIFTTAHEQYAIQAFKFSAMDYLLKPVDKDELIKAVNKVEQKIQKEDIQNKLDVLMQNMKANNDLSKKIAIPTNNGIFFVPVREIIRCEAKINYTDIFLTGNRRFTISRTLKDFESLLGARHFFRIHSAHLVNLNFIKSYKRGKGGSVVLEDHSELEVSTRRKESFLKKLSEL